MVGFIWISLQLKEMLLPGCVSLVMKCWPGHRFPVGVQAQSPVGVEEVMGRCRKQPINDSNSFCLPLSSFLKSVFFFKCFGTVISEYIVILKLVLQKPPQNSSNTFNKLKHGASHKARLYANQLKLLNCFISQMKSR